MFLVPQNRLDVTDVSQRATVEALLDAATISKAEVESWRLGDAAHSGADEANPELSHPLPPPPPDETHLTVYVHLKPPAQAPAGIEGPAQEISLEQWQSLEALWKTILGLEASIDASRVSMEGLQAEMEAAFKKPLTAEEKVHALQSDVSQWNKAKTRIHYELPKVREFIHRATWALTVSERKLLEEIVKNHIEPRNPFPGVDQVRERLEHLQKDRQVLYAQGTAVFQKCRATLAELQRALSALQRNAADRARQKRSAAREKGKFL
ncbi:MAG TPA: hypothetical protein VKD72_29210 [Gemmataceae bacterium]|nr:hypothetical protein [Gemmataceae bacterium]